MPAKKSKDTLDDDFTNIVMSHADAAEQDKDNITVHQLPKLFELLGVSPDGIHLYALAWKLNCKEPLKISREEWINGLRAISCTSVSELARRIESIAAETVPNEVFRTYYNFVFEWCRENSSIRNLPPEAACDLWPVLFKNRSFAHLEDFIEFLKERKVTIIQRDLWRQMYHFATADFKTWPVEDGGGHWPGLMHEFVMTKILKK